jgi:hypothetical protein
MSAFSDAIAALPNLRFAYSLDNGSTADSGGSGLTLTAAGSPGSVTGPVDGHGATSFDGSTQSMTRAHNAAFNFGTGDYTIGAWIKPADLTVVSRFLVGHDGDGGFQTWDMFQSGSTSGVIDTSWQFVAIVMDRDANGRWWRNGAWAAAGVSIASKSAVAIDLTEPLWIARRETAGFFPGHMAWVFGCAAALTDVQLLGLYNAATSVGSTSKTGSDTASAVESWAETSTGVDETPTATETALPISRTSGPQAETSTGTETAVVSVIVTGTDSGTVTEEKAVYDVTEDVELVTAFDTAHAIDDAFSSGGVRPGRVTIAGGLTPVRRLSSLISSFIVSGPLVPSGSFGSTGLSPNIRTFYSVRAPLEKALS